MTDEKTRKYLLKKVMGSIFELPESSSIFEKVSILKAALYKMVFVNRIAEQVKFEGDMTKENAKAIMKAFYENDN